MKFLVTLIAVTTIHFSLSAQANLWVKDADPVNEYFHVPMTHSPVLTFQALVLNIGDSTATNIVVYARVYNSSSALVYTGNSANLQYILPGDSAQFTIPSYALPFIEEKYVVTFTATMLETDADTSDNVLMMADTFYVTDSVFARDNGESYLPIATGGNSGGYLGQQFVLNQPAMLTSISGFFTSPLPCDVAFVVFAFNGIPGWVPIATSDTVQLSAVPLWVTLPMINPVYLNADTFVIAAQQFSSQIDLNLSSRNWTAGTTWVRWQALGGWQNIEYFGGEYAYPFMLRANLNFSVGEMEPGSASAFKLYPNPADQSVVVSTDGDEKIEITNTSGQVVSTTVASAMRTSIDVSGLPRGVYFIRVYGANGIRTEELIIE